MLPLPAVADPIESYRSYLQLARNEYVRQVLARCGDNVSKAAQMAGMNRTHFYRYLRAAGIDWHNGKHGNAAWQELGR
jgi:DNA-binding NtrC family response regulator